MERYKSLDFIKMKCDNRYVLTQKTLTLLLKDSSFELLQ
jgi:hypothetical protein